MTEDIDIGRTLLAYTVTSTRCSECAHDAEQTDSRACLLAAWSGGMCAGFTATTDAARPQHAVLTQVWPGSLVPCTVHGMSACAVVVLDMGTARRCLCRDCLAYLLRALQEVECL